MTALAVDPKCKPQECTLYVGAAGGGVWRSKNALAPNPSWKQISDGIPTNAIGSIAVDPNDPTGKTIYVGTGEANASGDSEAGVGLYKTTDDGAHWSLVPGAFAVANNRAIAWIAIEPGDREPHPDRRRARECAASARTAPAPGPSRRSRPPSASTSRLTAAPTFALTQAGSINEVQFDPSNPNVVYAAIGDRRPDPLDADGARQLGDDLRRSTAAASRSRR